MNFRIQSAQMLRY